MKRFVPNDLGLNEAKRAVNNHMRVVVKLFNSQSFKDDASDDVFVRTWRVNNSFHLPAAIFSF